MKRHFSSLLLAAALTVAPVMGQTLDRHFNFDGQGAFSGTAKQKTGIRLAPSNKYNIKPSQVFSFLKGNSQVVRPTLQAPQRIAAVGNVADSLLLYGLNVQLNDYRSPSPLPMQFFSFHAAPTFSYMQESNFALESPMAGFYAKGKFYALYSSMDYDDDWNTMTTARVDVYDAATWELLESKTIVDGDLGMNFYFRQVGVYDPTTDKAYCMGWGDWDGLNKPLSPKNLRIL